jgi:alcohol dehydrogenase
MTDADVTAMVLESPRQLVARRFPRPAIGAGDALLRVEACGLCGTDHEQYTGVLPSSKPFVPGHECVGVIEQIGAAAAERWQVSQGDRVAVEVFQSCRSCDECRAGAYRRCVAHGIGDMYGFIPIDKAPSLWGGYAERQYLGPDSMVLAVPPSLDPVTATLFNPLGAGIRWAVTLPGTRADDVVAVLGPGIRGLCAVAAAKEAGAGFVMVTGFGPGDRDRLALAARFGADLAVDVAVDDPKAALDHAVGRRADVVVDVTAKAPAALATAIDLARPGGTVVLAGTRGSADTPGFWPDTIVYKELRILGALGVDVDAYRAALDLLASGRYPFAELPRAVVDFDGLESLLQTMAGESADRSTRPVHGVLVPGAAAARPNSGGNP